MEKLKLRIFFWLGEGWSGEGLRGFREDGVEMGYIIKDKSDEWV